jgi:hypothetical protein
VNLTSRGSWAGVHFVDSVTLCRYGGWRAAPSWILSTIALDFAAIHRPKITTLGAYSVLQRAARNSLAGLVDPSAGPIGHVVVAPRWIPHCADAPCVSYMDNECSTGKIAVCGGKVQPDCVFPPQTAIFVRKHQDHLVNEVICPANRGWRVVPLRTLSTLCPRAPDKRLFSRSRGFLP